jgi:hypothetical protein
MTKTPEKQNIYGSVSGLELYWLRIKRKNDFVLKAQFREILGNPSKNTMAAYLKRPGSVKVSIMITMANWLTSVLDQTVVPQDLVKFH